VNFIFWVKETRSQRLQLSVGCVFCAFSISSLLHLKPTQELRNIPKFSSSIYINANIYLHLKHYFIYIFTFKTLLYTHTYIFKTYIYFLTVLESTKWRKYHQAGSLWRVLESTFQTSLQGIHWVLYSLTWIAPSLSSSSDGFPTAFSVSFSIADPYKLVLATLLFPTFYPPISPPSLDRRERRIEGRERKSSLNLISFLLFFFFECNPLKSSQNFKHHTITETICSWQSYALSRAWDKSQLVAMVSPKQPYIPTPGIKTKTFLCFCIFLNKFYWYEYTVAVFRHTRRGRQTPLQMVVSHHVFAGNWTQDLWKNSQCS
jgi:hypothetical protein